MNLWISLSATSNDANSHTISRSRHALAPEFYFIKIMLTFLAFLYVRTFAANVCVCVSLSFFPEYAINYSHFAGKRRDTRGSVFTQNEVSRLN